MMSLNDPLANAMSIIYNAQKRGKTECTIYPSSGIIKRVLKILQEARYLGEFKETKDVRGSYLVVQLIGAINKCGAIKPRFSVKKESHASPSRRRASSASSSASSSPRISASSSSPPPRA